MDNENIIIKGTPGKNKIAITLLVAGIAVLVIAFIVASYVYNNVDGFKYFGFGYGDWYTWCVIYDFKFSDFFFGEFFNFYCYYGYLLIPGVIAAVVGIIMKANTEKCEITVTDSRVYGKLARGKEVSIPLNQITGLHTCSFNGVSVASIGAVSDFHCIENQEEVMKALSYILANPQQNAAQSSEVVQSSSGGSEAEELKRFKNLLDSGVISKEEFEAKKKQILGL